MTSRSDTELGSRHVRLRAISSSDLDFLYHLACSPPTARTWRWRGMIPSPERFRSELWASDVVTQYLVESRVHSEPVGLVTAYGLPSGSGLKLGALSAADHAGSGLVAVGAMCLAAHCFISLPIHKMYVESLEDIAPTFGHFAHSILELEATFRRHDFHAGQPSTLQVYGIFPERLAAGIHSARHSIGLKVPFLDKWICQYIPRTAT